MSEKREHNSQQQESTAMDENSEEKKDERIPEWSIVMNTLTQSWKTDNGPDEKKSRWTKIKEILKQNIMRPLPMWKKIFIVICVVAVTLDPLFFYIPMIDQELKCIKTDKKLGILAVTLRSLVDIVYIVDIILNVSKAYEVVRRENLLKSGQMVKNALAVAHRLSWSLILIDFLAILPVPQVIIFVFVEGLGCSGSSKKKWLNICLLSQYVPRTLRIYQSCKDLVRIQDTVTRMVWVKGGLNFLLYILSSHVIGGFWYFYSFQREASCWKTRLICDKYKTICGGNDLCDVVSKNIELINKECPIDTNDKKKFNYGIFFEAIESGVLGSYDIPQKVMYGFCWGLRHLSSLGENLVTSTYIWENCFAMAITIIGLLLFMYLIGNLQTYMQLATTRSEEIGEKMKLKEREVEIWIEKRGLPMEEKTSIMQKVKQKLKENKEVDVENLLSILPFEDRKRIKLLLCLPLLRKVSMFQNMEKEVLDIICEHLEPMMYTERSYMIREGEPLDQMLFITYGTAWVYTNNASSHNNNAHDHHSGTNNNSDDSLAMRKSSTRRLKKYDYVGEELLEWSLTHNTLSGFPIATTNVKSHTKVEVFALRANDLMNIVRKNYKLFRRNIQTYSTNSGANVQMMNEGPLKSQSSKYQRL
ncbi:cyclic nucleotide-gated ion channel 1-like isoform X2 [Humulus lupulus]|uniref:cyclic nucleotide-gated ion channel 1-like isoform X2 n=1 Tax=Humulus lupulus TaxID=3486 RepID=UPI002B408C72|nr:cyclic nucleotide-gated ion channel 1-like isoform X2 [Humulus lupulus]